MTYDFGYQNGQWGPVAEMTESRYKVDGQDFWLWEKPEGHCVVCGEGSGYDWSSLFPDDAVLTNSASDQEYLTYDNVGSDDDDINYNYDNINIIEAGDEILDMA